MEIALKKSYIKSILNSPSTGLFKNLYYKTKGKELDILENGRKSCAVFVSSILYLFKLITDVHATIESTILDLEKSGWTKIKTPKMGSVIIWEEKLIFNNLNKHIGFCISKNQAISNSSELGKPKIHHLTYGKKNGKPIRKIIAAYWNSKLD